MRLLAQPRRQAQRQTAARGGQTSHPPQRQRGVALVLAMMIVTLVALVAVEVSWRFELSMSRSANRWQGVQAKAYLEGAEQLAMVVLQEDLKNDETKEADHLGEPWAAENAPFPTDHGWVSGRIEDAHGRFNLNLMTPVPGKCRNGGDPEPTSGQCPLLQPGCQSYTPAQQMFVRLLQTVNLGDQEEVIYLDQNVAEEITEAVIDWLDEDSNLTGFGGAESDYYESLEPPLAIANQEMVSVSELQVIKGMTPELYRQLLPLIIALPQEQVPRMNLNTLKPQILRTVKSVTQCDLVPHDEEVGQALAEFMQAGEFTDWQMVTDDPAVPTDWMQTGGQQLDINQTLFDFGPSMYFLLFSEAGIGDDYVRRGQSLIRREGGQSGGGNNANNPNSNNPNSNNPNSNIPNTNNPPVQPGRGGNQEIKIEVVRRSDANF